MRGVTLATLLLLMRALPRANVMLAAIASTGTRRDSAGTLNLGTLSAGIPMQKQRLSVFGGLQANG